MCQGECVKTTVTFHAIPSAQFDALPLTCCSSSLLRDDVLPAFSAAAPSTSSGSLVVEPRWTQINDASRVAYQADVPWWGAQKFCSAVSALMVLGADATPGAANTAETQLLVGTWCVQRRAPFVFSGCVRGAH